MSELTASPSSSSTTDNNTTTTNNNNTNTNNSNSSSLLKSNQVLIRIYFIDDTHKTLSIDPNNTTGDQLWEMVSEKIGINNKDSECFFIWAQNDEIEWLLFNHQNISEIIKNWGVLEKRYCNKDEPTSPILSGFSSIRGKTPSSPNISSSGLNNSGGIPPPSSPSSPGYSTGTIKGFLTLGKKNKISGASSNNSSSAISTTIASEHASKLRSSFPTLGEEGHFRLVYRPTSVLPLEAERSINKPEAVHLFYIQAIHNVIHSNYPCEEDVALKLASIQLQVLVGDQKLEHQDHLRESISRYIPSHMLSKRKPEEWEQLIIPQHALLRGSESLQLKKSYLETCQRWLYYGSTFFKAKYIPSNTSFFTQEFEGKVSIGINGNGFHIIDPKVMKMVSYSYRDIVAWDSSSNSFTIKFHNPNSSKSDSTKNYIFKTPQGELINDLLSDWSVEWETELKKQTKKK
ncbi:hypothetical protein DICPUDRAFT_155341 [Dictyostelium purpureum]|uniref:FERM domain-containing protein n=1 Tax=Dictyostelium purpureum TaxID=5786 RepID=F0ZTR0_DICPU|nr:uncharacterized protein DICPUDRAFT_155341 [Dictyostelium purpureum]EGC32674.1 hypothetical protein DICPUDRAFT_155341 [Dictyostelium purpureum]|eukprot:XP_003290807.1 hypothetical protein DICPUDRAFT_155341 [Dictyostelium purpureum]